MLDLNDARWTDLNGGYRMPYDPRPALARLERGEDVAGAWHELWNELHHQGDVDTASYAAVPHLLRVHRARGVPDWNTFVLLWFIGVIALARGLDRASEILLDFTDDELDEMIAGYRA